MSMRVSWWVNSSSERHFTASQISWSKESCPYQSYLKESLKSLPFFYSLTGSTDVATDTLAQLAPFRTTATYIAAYSISDVANITTDWLPVISCTSDIGSPSAAVCIAGAFQPATTQNAYLRLDIQIEYTKIGSLANPQSVLSGVIFNYQSIVSDHWWKLFLFIYSHLHSLLSE